LKFADRIGFCRLSLLRSFLGSKKGKKVAKIAKRFFFVLFASFCPFCFPKKPKIHYLVGLPQNLMRSGNLRFEIVIFVLISNLKFPDANGFCGPSPGGAKCL